MALRRHPLSPRPCEGAWFSLDSPLNKRLAQGRIAMTGINRRRFLKVSAGGAAAATTGGMAAVLATGQPPAYAQASTLHWLRWTDFVPASDQVLRNDIAKQAEKDLGLKLN